MRKNKLERGTYVASYDVLSITGSDVAINYTEIILSVNSKSSFDLYTT